MKTCWSLTVLTITIVQAFYACAEADQTDSTKIESLDLLKDTKIAVVRENGKGAVIYMINPDGTNPVQLTHDQEVNTSPSWSPDGKKIAFMSTREGKPEIYVMNANGTDQVRLTKNEALDDFFSIRLPDFPSWSPDGKKIAFVSDPRPEHRLPEIYVMNADGTNQTRLTHTPLPPDSWIPVGPLSWSPDGEKIVLVATKDDNAEIHVMNADGTNWARLTNHEAHDSHPSWSPEGKKIVFQSERYGNAEIYIMNADGTNLINLTNNEVFDGFPSWSPDGRKIAFNHEREIYVMNADGTNQTRIAEGDFPVWSPFLR